jgi:hypothetical protein
MSPDDDHLQSERPAVAAVRPVDILLFRTSLDDEAVSTFILPSPVPLGGRPPGRTGVPTAR